MKTLQLYLADLKELLEAKDFVSARTLLREVNPIDLADAWDHFTPEQREVVFRLLTRQKASQFFEELDPPHQKELLESLQTVHLEELLEGLDPAAVGRLARQMPQTVVRHCMTVMKKAGQENVQKYLDYPPQSVGALMRGRYLTLEPPWTAKHAVERIQASTRLRHVEETHLDALMVVDGEGRLLGVVPLKALVVAPPSMTVRELMNPAPRTLEPEMDQEEAVRLFSHYKLKYAPVVAVGGKLLGIVVYSDIFDVAKQETEEDFAKMAGVRKAGLLSEPVLSITRVRLPWLIATCLGEMVVSYIVKHYELTLSRVVALATFIPLIAAMGGNVGAQTATVMVRGLATGEIRPGEEKEAVGKEVAVGLLLGVFYGLVMAAAAWAFYGDRYGWRFAAVVGLGMMVSMTTAATAGSLEPLVFRRLGIDPATATGPLITTFTDLLSTFAYFSMATYFLLH